MICATPPTMPVRNNTSESAGDGLIQPHGIETSEASVAISENEKTSEAVLSVALMWRTCVIAAAVRKAPATANSAPITGKEKVAPSCSAMPRKTFIAGLASWIGASNFPNRLLLSAFVSRRRDALQQRKRHRRRNRCDQQAQLFARRTPDRAPNA